MLKSKLRVSSMSCFTSKKRNVCQKLKQKKNSIKIIMIISLAQAKLHYKWAKIPTKSAKLLVIVNKMHFKYRPFWIKNMALYALWKAVPFKIACLGSCNMYFKVLLFTGPRYLITEIYTNIHCTIFITADQTLQHRKLCLRFTI